MDNINGNVLGATQKASYFFESLNATSWFYIAIDVVIVSILIYWAYLFLKETRAMRILYGLFILLALMLVGRLFDLVLLNWILQYLMAMLVVAIPIVFQPELRNALEKLGRPKLLSSLSKSNKKTDTINEMLRSIVYFSKEKIGALIILQRQTGLREYAERGVVVDAKVSEELIRSIFNTKSPLHDGAVMVVGDRIVSASVTLPVADYEEDDNLGFRHRAGIGITQNSDAIAIVVSEENGSVSVCVGGQIEKRVGEERLRKKIRSLISKES